MTRIFKILPIILLLQTGIILSEEGGYEFWTDEPKVETVKVIREVVYVNQTSQISTGTGNTYLTCQCCHVA